MNKIFDEFYVCGSDETDLGYQQGAAAPVVLDDVSCSLHSRGWQSATNSLHQGESLHLLYQQQERCCTTGDSPPLWLESHILHPPLPPLRDSVSSTTSLEAPTPSTLVLAFSAVIGDPPQPLSVYPPSAWQPSVCSGLPEAFSFNTIISAFLQLGFSWN